MQEQVLTSGPLYTCTQSYDGFCMLVWATVGQGKHDAQLPGAVLPVAK